MEWEDAVGGRGRPPRCQGERAVMTYPIDRRPRLCARVGKQHLFVVVRRRSCVVRGVWLWWRCCCGCAGRAGAVRAAHSAAYVRVLLSCVIGPLPWSLLQKTQFRKMPSFPVVARTPFWSFCAGQRRIGPGQITDGT